MHRRMFLGSCCSLAGGAFAVTSASGGQFFRAEVSHCIEQAIGPTPTYSVVPVVGDGKWVWTKPPSETGYLDPRPFTARIGIELEGTGNAREIKATTVVPVELPEQKIEKTDLEKDGCDAAVRQLTEKAGQLVLAAGGITKGQKISASVTYRLTLRKSYLGYQQDQFPAKQEFSREVRKAWCFDSPGIQTQLPEVKKLAEAVGGEKKHPWAKAEAFYHWVWDNIRAQPGPYTSVPAAIRDKAGDCEERAATFIALCRVSGIPARLVWVPNHNWAEICLKDERGEAHWLPIHTSCYSWFGWTGAHELVLQKGDSLFVPEKHQPQRLLADWFQWQGAKPKARWTAELTPLPATDSADIGPGHRRKDEKGEWVVIGNHAIDPILRDGRKIVGTHRVP